MNKFKKIVKQSGKNAYEISRETGIPNQNIYSYLNGTRTTPSLATGFKLADCLGIDINELRDAFTSK
ncbi:helix-turn-helix transcriptional regulator [Aerococcus sp. HMSC23C02]|uniref:helix-turn-helix domain-containing protein n=1 Tax=Aerococcus sp. HMSC23C02 TaxID=1581058 RepID=UPI0008A4200A|nr:helix-turn-helix transcriptional regulator [Aerococcus sp. HMSC23C02]OFT95912.1 hypothetical protein HMPREF3090_03570 [Aerococcus sp. HMSC23C02]